MSHNNCIRTALDLKDKNIFLMKTFARRNESKDSDQKFSMPL